jgi:hypothetical protein
MHIFTHRLLTIATALVCGFSTCSAETKGGYTKLFDGKTLTGWMLLGGVGPGYVPKDGILECPKEGGGNLVTEKEYSDFAFKFDFRLHHGSNNGVGLRTPLEGNLSYTGMESQILDNDDPMYKDIQPWQVHGSIYGIIAAKRGALKPVGEWNHEEITAMGRHMKVVLNGVTIVDGDLNSVKDPAILAEHPGMLRNQGHVGFLGHGPETVEFKEIWIKDLEKPERDNTAPKGFAAVFNGKDLQGWKGLVSPDGGPPGRAKMSSAELAAAQIKADQQMRDHWTVIDGAFHYDGKGNSLCTAKDYGDFELLVDWKIKERGDSGIYLRGSPQVQIWDPVNHPGRPGEGSGGLYNNQKNPNGPTKVADKPVGQWNRFRILMVGDKVTVYLNGEVVVHNVTMENYWERDKPIYPTGQIELQHHGDELWFKNVYIREIAR